MKIVLLALYNFHSYAIRGFHSFLRDKGYDVESVYFKSSIYTDNPPTQQEIERLVEEIGNPDIIAVSVHSPLFDIFKKISIQIREKTISEIIVGGEHPTADPDSCLDYADYIVVGDGENILIDIIEDDPNYGIYYGYPVDNLDDLPLPWYGEGCHYIGINTFPKTYSYLTGKGCPYKCSYCSECVRKEPLRRKSVDRVIEDIKELSVIFNWKNIVFSDSIFTLNRKWLEEFCDKFKNISLNFTCYGHPIRMDKETIVMMKDAGLLALRTGVQSGSRFVRNSIFNRHESLEEIEQLAWNLYDCGVVGTFDFITNNPYDDRHTIKETRDFIKRLPDYCGINYFELRWFPGTPLTHRALNEGVILEEDVEGNFNRFGHWDYAYMRGNQ